MAKIQLWRSNLEAARDRCELSTEDAAAMADILSVTTTSHITFEIESLPVEVARALLEDSKIKPNQRAVLAMRVHGVTAQDLDCEAAYSTIVATPLAFAATMSAMSRKKPNAELHWNGRWYPVIVLTELSEDPQDKSVTHVIAKVSVGMGKTKRDLQWHLEPALFRDESGRPADLTVLEVLRRLGFRALQITAAQFNLRLVAAERLAAETGLQVWVKNAVLDIEDRFWFGGGLSQLPLGTADMPRRGIIEAHLANINEDRYSYFGVRHEVFGESVSRLPLVRLFSLDMKRYVFADVDDLEAYQYDDTALSRLVLPSDMKSVLQRVFETPTEELFGDLIRGKHGGIVILACGKPGVGKTLTAEVYAEMASRPLYVLEFGELGTTVDAIEQNLQNIFARIVRWKAVLQFDECEIFLSQRGGDLERSAIVGIFLRMLDYYEGLLFLTTNRAETLDEAIRSRVMLRLDYPDLDVKAREQIWQEMFAAAELSLRDGSFAELAQPMVNGRQIRNFVRLTRILHPERTVTLAQVLELLKYGDV